MTQVFKEFFCLLLGFYLFLIMPGNRKKSPATEGKRKTRASDKARSTPRKSKKQKSASFNDGSYLQSSGQQPPVSTADSSTQPLLSATTGQAILDMLSKLDASNQELSRRMDRFERNGSISSTPLTSPTIQPVNRGPRATSSHQAALIHPTHQNIPAQLATAGADSHGTTTEGKRPPLSVSDARDAVAPKVDALRSIPSISTAVSQLLASYEQQCDREVLQGKATVLRKKSGRYNTTDTTSMGPQFRWPNEGLVSASHLKKPAYDELTLAQWVSGQLANILQIDDHVLARNVLIQMTASMKDTVSLPWAAVRSAWAVSMTDIEEGRLGWADSTQWSINRISNSQLAMHNVQTVASSGSKVRICRFFNEGTCNSEGHHGTYKHFCAYCFKLGRSLGHPETRCYSRNTNGGQDQRSSVTK